MRAHVTVFGGAAFMNGATQAQADASLEVLLEYGINHIDTAKTTGDADLLITAHLRACNCYYFLGKPVEALVHGTEW
jgi:aryl-alcohol dehydrogenase-like predicted oxidoreductase